jgi:UDP-glucose 4-epimerase
MKLIAGASGVLGSGFVDVLRHGGEPFIAMQLPWGDPSGAANAVVAHWRAAEKMSAGSPITLVWAAGTGTVGASEQAMAAETATLAAVLEALAGAVTANLGNRLLFTSSAGAIYGGHGTGVIDEVTPPAPITPYGREKLAQEGLVTRLSDAGVMSTLACRFTNVYGLAGGRMRRKGLVPALVEAAMLRLPVRLFVSPDTRRDYLVNGDAARLALAELDAVGDGSAVPGWGVGHGALMPPVGVDRRVAAPRDAWGTAVAPAGPMSAVVRPDVKAHRTVIVRSGHTMTVLDLVSSVSRVLRRRVPVVITESPESRVQPLVLRFRERRGIQAAIPTTSFEAAIRSMAEAPRG